MNSYSDIFKLLLEYWKESREAAKERLKLPIVPLYLTLLVMAYWKPISIYILSTQNIEGKIGAIEKLYIYWSFWDHLGNILILLLLSFVSSAIFPLLMWGLDSLLIHPNNYRKGLRITSKNIDRAQDLLIAKHKFEQTKILSGSKEVEEYNQSIEDLKRSYEDRISNIETVSLQKEANLKSELTNFQLTNEMLDLEIRQMQEERDKLLSNNNYYNSEIYRINKDARIGNNNLRNKILLSEKQVILLGVFNGLQKNIEQAHELISLASRIHGFSGASTELLLSLLNNDMHRLFAKIIDLTEDDGHEKDLYQLKFELGNQYDIKERDFIKTNELGFLVAKFENREIYDLKQAKDQLFEMRLTVEDIANRNVFKPFPRDDSKFAENYKIR